MSVFNAEAFAEQVFDQENATQYVPVPEGEYTAFIEDFSFKHSDDYTCLLVTWVIPDEKLEETLGMDQVQITQRVYLDLAEGPDGRTTLDYGTNKNVKLGRLRAALGLNKAGKAFQFSQLRSKQAKISVLQSVNPEDATQIYSNVKDIAKA